MRRDDFALAAAILVPMLFAATLLAADPPPPSTAPSKPDARKPDPVDTESRIIKLVAKHFGVEARAVNRKTRFKEDLKADELDGIEIVMEVEDVFEISIPDEAAQKLKTVGDYVDYVNRVRKK